MGLACMCIACPTEGIAAVPKPESTEPAVPQSSVDDVPGQRYDRRGTKSRSAFGDIYWLTANDRCHIPRNRLGNACAGKGQSAKRGFIELEVNAKDDAAMGDGLVDTFQERG